jgi:TonB family protein
MMYYKRAMILILLFAVWSYSLAAQPISSAKTPEDFRTRKNDCTGRSLEHLVVERVAPTWPPERDMQVIGDVTVRITIDENGNLISARAICGHPLKKSFAISAVRKWKFRPNIVRGKARKASGVVVVYFPPEQKDKDRRETSTYNQEPPNKALQRRPRSESLIKIGVSHAAPLNAGVMLLAPASQSRILKAAKQIDGILQVQKGYVWLYRSLNLQG